MDSKPIVLITGISGYLGSHVCNLFLQDGGFKVRGSVRDKNNEKKLQPLKDAFKEKYNELELCEVDLNSEESMIKAAEGCTYIVHTASPFPMFGSAMTEENTINPAVNGTMAAMKAAHKNKVKRVVITSSCASIICQKPENFKSPYTEADWSDSDVGDMYSRSKTIAEKAAWEFQKGLPEGERFEITTILPGLILGPNFIVSDFTSGKTLAAFMMGHMNKPPPMTGPNCDVREVSNAHYLAIKKPEAANKRFIISTESNWMIDLGLILKEKYGEWYDINPEDHPKERPMIKCDRTHSEQVLGLKYRPFKETVYDMAEAMIKLGIIPEKRPQ